MRKKIRGSVIIFVLFMFCGSLTPASAKDVYLLKRKLNTVQVKKADSGLLEKTKLNHPHLFDSEDLKNILSSIRFSKQILIIKDIDNAPLFPSETLDELLPHLVEAFRLAEPDQVVFFSYIVQNPKFLIRNDHLTFCRAFIVGDELHLEFGKLYAKLFGDYQKKNEQRLVNQARGLRVSLEPTEGQYLDPNDPKTLIVDLKRDYAVIVAEREKRDREQIKKVGVKKDEVPLPSESVAATRDHSKNPADTLLSSPPQSSVEERLRVLKQLREDELITEKEYKRKKKELLKDL